MHYSILALLLAAISATASPAYADDARPNVVLIMADDLGYNDLTCYGSKKLRTPKLDQLAKDGIRLTNFYTGCTVCTPSRMALLTGAYPPRCGWRGGVVGYGVKTVNGLAPEALTMAEVFKSAGYQTALCGKWHLGDAEEMSPMKQGFDSVYYIKKSNNQTKKLFRGGELIENPFENRLLTEQFTAEAIKFVKANQDKPFFLYLPYTAPHFPAQAHPDWKGKSPVGAYGDVVEELDSRIGELLEVLKTEKLEENTIVVFLSDNGPDPSQRKWASAAPFRGLKWSPLEGGTRVPCIIRWPQKIAAGQTSAQLAAAIDLLPTLAHACQIDLAELSNDHPNVDGVNVLGILTGDKSQPQPRNDLLFFHGWGQTQAIRVGDWKLYIDGVKEISGSERGPVLINLKDDPGETTDVSEQHPERVAQMQALAEKQIAEIKQNSIPLGGPPLQKR